ncbi:hypothetical protein COLO4_01374 [Corchorus olitorius]|uniref:Uncharacterized protein n=1 Tax=Corchorus olitorius TaxID=93759 RepID=A0A1R3L2S1_9ROSI|nr:hypothetical protein COLO4_01374 [Corchorus olitorius]
MDLDGRHVDHRLDRLQTEAALEIVQTLGAGIEDALAHRHQVFRRGHALEHGAPVGAIAHLAAQQVFHQAGLLARGDPQDRQRLVGALVDPAGGQLGGAGDAHLEARGVGQVDDVGHHAMGFAPLRLATGAMLVVALFGADDAAVALGQGGEAGIAVALAEALAGLAAAVGAVDGAQVFQAQATADQRIDRYLALVEAKGVVDGVGQGHGHLAQGATAQFGHHGRNFSISKRREAITGLQTELDLVATELAAVRPLADLHGQLEAFVDIGGDVFQHLGEGCRHGSLRTLVNRQFTGLPATAHLAWFNGGHRGRCRIGLLGFAALNPTYADANPVAWKTAWPFPLEHSCQGRPHPNLLTQEANASRAGLPCNRAEPWHLAAIRAGSASWRPHACLSPSHPRRCRALAARGKGHLLAGAPGAAGGRHPFRQGGRLPGIGPAGAPWHHRGQHRAAGRPASAL